VEGMHRITILQEPIVYSNFRTAVIGYDSQDEVYDLMFKEELQWQLTKEWMQMKCPTFATTDISYKSYSG
jgi:hypothetical protein